MDPRLPLSLLLLALAAPAAAQPVFTDVTPASNRYFVTPEDEDFWLTSLAPADVDGDGDLDFAALGFYVVYNQSATDRLLLFENEGPDPSGNWVFGTVEVTMPPAVSIPASPTSPGATSTATATRIWRSARAAAP